MVEKDLMKNNLVTNIPLGPNENAKTLKGVNKWRMELFCTKGQKNRDKLGETNKNGYNKVSELKVQKLQTCRFSLAIGETNIIFIDFWYWEFVCASNQIWWILLIFIAW